MNTTRLAAHLAEHGTCYLSITGLRIKPGPLNVLRFWYHAMRSYRQAAQAGGNLHTATKGINGVQHTLTAWTDREAMLRFLRSGAHLQAMRAFPRIATGGTFGYEANVLPDWTTVHTLWQERAVAYHPRG